MANKETSLKNIHEIELDILCKCREICDKHNIPYYLCYGTLLGAVRHEGFIPRDAVALWLHPEDYTLGIFVQEKLSDVVEIDSIEELAQIDSSYKKYL